MSLQETFDRIDLEEIRQYVTDRKNEDLTLDFKTVNDPRLDRDDRKNLAKALSGFANSGGGIVVWGVNASKGNDGVDCARYLSPIQNLGLFKSRLQELTGEMVVPSVDGVQHKSCSSENDCGFAVTLVPESDSGPHMAKGGEDRYFKRSGDSFYRMEHFDIEDMFGRRKKPRLSLGYRLAREGSSNTGPGGCWKFDFRIVLYIENTGRGVARAPYAALSAPSPYNVAGGICRAGYDPRFGLPLLAAPQTDRQRRAFGGSSDFVIHPGTRHDVTGIEMSVHQSQEIQDMQEFPQFSGVRSGRSRKDRVAMKGEAV
ncbi:ATP-binding protein [Candidatus Sumerlaeota bacterium]|nr:ATP-binding protein [Candidatus Sumerlaeota bacterium]